MAVIPDTSIQCLLPTDLESGAAWLGRGLRADILSGEGGPGAAALVGLRAGVPAARSRLAARLSPPATRHLHHLSAGHQLYRVFTPSPAQPSGRARPSATVFTGRRLRRNVRPDLIGSLALCLADY